MRTEGLAGIDYGSKMAGTTSICWSKGPSLVIEQSEKKQDADQFLADLFHTNDFDLIAIDAPLSLPAAYRHPDETDYFFRTADREVGAMSPMFLGGLTARAMRLQSMFASAERSFIECYPAGLVRQLKLEEYYKKDLALFAERLAAFLPTSVPDFTNWHQADSVLAWLSAYRFRTGTHESFGRKSEGVIIL